VKDWSRNWLLRVVLAASASTALTVAAAAAPAQAKLTAPLAAAPSSGWSVTPTPNPEVPTGQLFWVSCTTANSCMAVGAYAKTSGQAVTLAEQWNGKSWRILQTPNPLHATYSALFGVTCGTLSACTAVGLAIIAGTQQTLAERWNGTTWNIQATPTLPAGGGFLNAVSCATAAACIAVGQSNIGGAYQTLAERWDGTTWSLQTVPNPAPGAGLSGVSCTSPSACVAVGATVGGSATGRSLAERWNGTTWRIQQTANPPQGGAVLTSVTCASSSLCTAVGLSNAGTLAEAWDGTNWSIQTTPTPAGAQLAFLNSVACASPSACTADGFYQDSSGTWQALVEHWDGTAWQSQLTPNPGLSFLYGLACTPGAACVAVGYSDINGSPAVLVERSSGTTWSTQPAPNQPGAAASYLNSAWCASPSACVTVGSATNSSRVTETLAELWNGRAWRIQPTPNPPDGGFLVSVSCTSLSACTAVGGTNIGTTLAQRWDGHQWSMQFTANPAGGGFLGSVSCASISACTAVGNTNGGKTLAERWNGTSWTIQPTPNPAGPAFAGLVGVACASSSECMAVGGRVDNSGNGAGTLAERWNGTTWQIVPTFMSTGTGSFLNGVACTSSTACTAVGSSGPVTTLAERWNGAQWHVQPTPNPQGGYNLFLASVACPASTVCTAFGLNLTGSGPFTVAERWNGQDWRIQPTPAVATFDLGFPAVACSTASSCLAVSSWIQNGNDPHLTLAEQWSSSDSQNMYAPVGNLRAGPACQRLQSGTRLMPRVLSSRLAMTRPSFSRVGAWRIIAPPCRDM